MSDSDRSEFVALVAVVCTVVVFLIGLAAGLVYPANEQVRPASYQQEETNPGNDVAEAITSPDHFDFWRDTFPQWAMAVFAAVATGASIVGIALLRRTFEETKRTADAAVEANLAAQRTWVTIAVNSVMPPVRVWKQANGEVGVMGGVFVEAKNVGSIPAPYVQIGVTMYYGTSGYSVSETRRREMIARLTTLTANSDRDGSALAPGEMHKQGHQQAPMMRDPFEEWERDRMRKWGDFGKPRFTISAHCWVIYRTVGSDKWRYTSLLAVLRKKDGTEWDSVMGEFPPDQIEVRHGLPVMT